MAPDGVPRSLIRAHRRLLAAAALVVLTALTFSPVLRNGFVLLDDDIYLAENEVVMRGLTLPGVHLALTSSYAANWHPLTWVSHMVDVDLFGLDPRGHHLMGLAIHAAAAVALFYALSALTARVGASFATAALFAVHPLRVESVAWAAERKDVLSGLLFFLTLLAWARYARRPGPGRYAGAVALFILGLMAKPMVVTLPLVLLLLDWWPLGRVRTAGPAVAGPPALRRLTGVRLWEKAPFFALSAADAYLTLRAQVAGGSVVKLEDISFPARAANALASYAGYIGQAAWPFDLTCDYPHLALRFSDPGVAAAGFLLVVASGAAWLLRRRQPWLLAGWSWYLVMLLPVIGLIQVGDQARADRYTYLPLVGIALALCWTLGSLSPPRPALNSSLRALTAAALAVCVPMTMRQVTLWHDDETLFTHALRVSSNGWKSANNLGVSRENAGRTDEALRLYREAARMKPTAATPRYNIGELLERQGRLDEALDALRSAVRLEPDSFNRMRLALLLERQGLDEEAIAQLRTLIRESPELAAAHNNLAALLARRGELAEARRQVLAALEIDPTYPDALFNLRELEGGFPGADAGDGALTNVKTTLPGDRFPRGLPAR